MFIQCQNCQATYKIDEEKVPDQNTFVRCSKCDAPISLNRQEQSALSRQKPHKIVDCPSCGTRYSIPLEKLTDGVIPVRCGKCSHEFDVSADDPQQESMPDAALFGDMDDDVSMDNIDIPEENKIEVDGLFDEDDERDDSFDEAAGFGGLDDFEDPELEDDINDATTGPTEAYLESVDLSVDAGEERDEESELDDISSAEREDLFLKPSTIESMDDGAAGQLDPHADHWPDIHDETESIEAELDDFVELDELGDISDSADDDAENPLELQEMTGKRGSRRVWIVSLLVLLFAILGAAGWFYLQTDPALTTTPPVETFSKQSRLKILEPLNGRFVSNETTGSKIFMLEGKIRNNYDNGSRINWVEVKGSLFDRNQQMLSEATTYAGKILSPETLQQASAAELTAIRAETSNVMDLELESAETVPFQILFFDVDDNIQKLQAQISRFSRKQVSQAQ